MNLRGVVIDCGWLCQLGQLPYDDLQVALQFLQKLEADSVPLLLDQGGHILAEYARNLSRADLGQRFLSSQLHRGRFEYYSGHPNKRCADALAAIAFDLSDVPYVAAASVIDANYLTHEEKHLQPDRVAAVLAACGVTIIGTAQLPGLLT